jgi:hypothetical protein
MTISFGESDHSTFHFDPVLSMTDEQLSQLMEKLGSSYTRLQGDNVQSDHCFLHNNDSATLGISINAPHPWNCFVPNCKKGKDVQSLVAAALHIDRQSALTWIYKEFPSLLEKRGKAMFVFSKEDEAVKGRFVLAKSALAAYPLDQSNRIGYRAVQHPRPPHNRPLCSEAQADLYHLGYDLRYHRIIYPVFHDDGELAGLIGRCMLPSCPKEDRWFNYDEGKFKKSRCLMGAELPVDQDHPIVVVEGPSDYIVMRSLGVPNVRAFMGAEYSEFQFNMVASYGLPIVPLFDCDKAGIEALGKFRKKASKNGLRLLPFRYPQAAFVNGKADPGNLTEESISELLASFKQVFKLR